MTQDYAAHLTGLIDQLISAHVTIAMLRVEGISEWGMGSNLNVVIELRKRLAESLANIQLTESEAGRLAACGCPNGQRSGPYFNLGGNAYEQCNLCGKKFQI